MRLFCVRMAVIFSVAQLAGGPRFHELNYMDPRIKYIFGGFYDRNADLDFMKSSKIGEMCSGKRYVTTDCIFYGWDYADGMKRPSQADCSDSCLYWVRPGCSLRSLEVAGGGW